MPSTEQVSLASFCSPAYSRGTCRAFRIESVIYAEHQLLHNRFAPVPTPFFVLGGVMQVASLLQAFAMLFGVKTTKSMSNMRLLEVVESIRIYSSYCVFDNAFSDLERNTVSAPSSTISLAGSCQLRASK